MIRAVLFDFDGLLLDTEHPELLAWQEVYAGLGCSLSAERWAENIGKDPGDIDFSPYDDLERLLRCEIDRGQIRAARRKRFNELMLEQSLMPGAEALLREAEMLGVKIAIVSSSPHAWIVDYLNRFDLVSAFEAIICRNHVTSAKPDPELYNKALSTLDIRAQEAIAFEDSAHGVSAAKQAGIFCVAVPNEVTRHCDLRHADLVIGSLANITLARLIAEYAAVN